MLRTRWIAILVAALVLAVAGSATAQSPQSASTGKRIALVIGNGGYQYVPRLANPTSDARLMAETLRELGFTLIGDKAQEDLDKPHFDQAVQTFGNEIQGAAVALFYYAGHGIQVNGSNYLVPVSANPTREADVDFQMVGVQLILHQMDESGAKLNLVILDACRNSPFGGKGLRSTSSGLAQMQAPTGTLISYATQPGNVAADGTDGHSPYTQALVASMREPGRGIFDVFNQVGLKVMASTAGVQQPWLASSPIEGQFFFVPAQTAGTPQPAPQPALQPTVQPAPQPTAQPSRQSTPQPTQTAMVVPARPTATPNTGPSPSHSPQQPSAAAKDCDALAASPFDKSRPADVPGVLVARLDTGRAEPACRKAVQEQPSPRLYFQLGRVLFAEHKDADALRLFRLAADQGMPDAQTDLGIMYRDGRGVAQSDAEAARLFRIAADQGQAVGQLSLGALYRNGRGVAQSDAEALRLYRLAADQGNPGAQNNLGVMYRDGRGVAQSDAEAVRLFRLAADQGNALGQLNLGIMFHNGRGVTQSDAEAMRLYRLAAAQGDPAIQNDLGIMYRDGRGVARSDAEAVRLFRLAADQGNQNGQWDLAWMYQTGRGVAQSYPEAARLYRLAADQGNQGGQFRLAILYQTGHGVAQSEAEAARLYRLAADQGHPGAQNNLGVMYRDGRGVAQSDAEAVRLFRLAAERGDLEAQKNLGDMYQRGRGVPRSLPDAISWYQRAARAGLNDAQAALKALGQTW